MRRIALLLVTVLLAAVLLAGGIGTATAQPGKNQIEVPVKCTNGEKYTLVFNAMSKTGQIKESTSNVVVKSGTVTYITETGERTTDTFDQGNAEGLQGDLITCRGKTTTELFGLGEVTAIFKFEGLVTPRSK